MSSAFDTSHAVVVGVDAYGGGIPALRSAVNDARRLADVLEREHGYTVTRVFDEAANGAALAGLLDRTLPAAVGPGDRVLFYFAGHGVALDGDDGPAGFILPQDAVVGDRGTYLEMTRLHDALMSLPCRHMLVVLDSCFSGAFRWSSFRDVLAPPRVLHRERYERFLHDPAWQVLTSAAYDQAAADQLLSGTLGTRGGEGVHSPFAVALFEALAGGADLMPAGGDGIVTATELFVYLEDRLQTETMALGRRQTPGLWPLRKHGKGEFIFRVPGKEVDLPPAPVLTFEHNPWRGLEAYGEAEADLFFGRDEAVRELIAYVDSHPLTVVLGASGTGKSSLVRAGVLPALREREDLLVLPVMRPGMAPLDALRATLGELPGWPAGGGGPPPRGPLGVSRDDVSGGVTSWLGAHPGTRVVLVVDQLEELATQEAAAREMEPFIALLAALLREHGERLRVVFTVRSDFEPQFAGCALEPLWRAGRYVARAFTQDELRQIIEQPASRRVLFFQPPELVDTLINEVVATPGGLPLLSFALSEMYQHYLRAGRDDRALTAADYEAVGGVVGALRTRADEEYRKLDEPHRATLRAAALRMVSMEGGTLARRRILRTDLDFESDDENARVRHVLAVLAAARLVVAGQADDGAPFVEPAHDALVRAWDRLVGWMHEEGRREVTDLGFRHRLTRAATEWEEERQPAAKGGHLWRDPGRSAVLQQLLRSHAPWLNRRERAFARRSVRSRRRTRMAWSATGVLGFVLAAVATVAGLRAADSARTATQEALVAQATALGVQAQQQPDPTLRLLLSTQALRMTVAAERLTDGLPGRFRSAVHEAPLQQTLDLFGELDSRVMYQGWVGWMRQGAHGEAHSWFSPDGAWLVTGVELLFSDDAACCFDLWDLSEANPGFTARPLGPDSSVVATGATVDEELATLSAGGVRTLRSGGDLVLFSSDSRWLATGHNDSTVQLRRLEPGGARAPVVRHRLDALPGALAISADARWLAVAAGTVDLWDLSGQPDAPSLRLTAAGEVVDVTFSADGTRMATATSGGVVQLWPLPAGPTPLHTFRTGSAASVRFSPDDRWLAVESDEGLTLWDLAAPGYPSRQLPHERHTNGNWVAGPDTAVFSPDGKWVLTTVDYDAQQINRLHASEGTPPLDGGRVAAPAVFSDDGRWLVGGLAGDLGPGQEGPVAVLDLASGQRQFLPGDAVFSPGAGRVFVGNGGGVLEAWDLAAARVVPVFAGGWPASASRDGRWITVQQDEYPGPSTDVHLVDTHRPGQAALKMPPGTWGQTRFSPNADRAVFQNYAMSRLVNLAGRAENPFMAAGLPGERIVAGGSGSQDTPPSDPDPATNTGTAPGATGRWRVRIADGAVHLFDGNRPAAPPITLDSVPSGNSYTPVFSPDERWLAVGEAAWDLGRGGPPFPRFRLAPPGEASRIYSAEGFTADSRWMFVRDAQSAAMALCSLREPAGAMLTCAMLEGAEVGPAMSGVAFSADGHWLVTSGTADPPVETQVWNLRHSNPAAHALRLQGRQPLGLAPDGGTLFTDAGDGRVASAWNLNPDTLLVRACRTAGRNLSLREWSRYLGERPYACTCPALPRGDVSGRMRCER